METVELQPDDEAGGEAIFKNPLLTHVPSQEWKATSTIDVSTDGLEQSGVRLKPGDQVRCDVGYPDGAQARLTFEFVGMSIDPELKGPAFRFVGGPRRRDKDVDKVGQFISANHRREVLQFLSIHTQALFRPRFGRDEEVKGFNVGVIKQMQIKTGGEGITDRFHKESVTVPGKRIAPSEQQISPAERGGLLASISRLIRRRIGSDVPQA